MSPTTQGVKNQLSQVTEKKCIVLIIKALTKNYFKIFRMQRAHPEEYNFTPQTWVLPAEYPFSFVYNNI